MLRDVVRLARPRDWLKNLFVLLPVPFALADGAELEPVSFLLGLLAFALAASSVYAFNDSLDAERDRSHPEKRNRPVAAGRVSPGTARLFSLALLLAAAGLAVAADRPGALPVLGAYVGLNLFYCFVGRHVPLLDVFLLSSGFVLRVLMGCALLPAEASNWLLLCSSTLALFLGLAKRRSDLTAGVDEGHRPSLLGYTAAFLDQAMTVTAGMTLIAYALYCIEAEVLVPGREFATLPFVVFGVLEYLRLVQVRGKGGTPVDLLLGSPALQLCGLGWVAATLWSVRPGG